MIIYYPLLVTSVDPNGVKSNEVNVIDSYIPSLEGIFRNKVRFGFFDLDLSELLDFGLESDPYFILRVSGGHLEFCMEFDKMLDTSDISYIVSIVNNLVCELNDQIPEPFLTHDDSDRNYDFDSHMETHDIYLSIGEVCEVDNEVNYEIS